MLLTALVSDRSRLTLGTAAGWLAEHPEVCSEVAEVLEILRSASRDHRPLSLGLPGVPLQTHARYSRAEVLAAFGVGDGALPPRLQAGVYWCSAEQTDLFFVTLDKSAGTFSPTTRYRDYAISPELFHWESQAATSRSSPTGQRYLRQREAGTNVALFVRDSVSDRAFWSLGLADYEADSGERPIAITWRLRRRMPGDVFSLAAAVA
jgi:hypothetical protein